jgi:DNA-binding transcriptional ArsR family regulator
MMGVNEMGVQATQTELLEPATAPGASVDALVDTLHHPAKDEIELAAVLHALSDPMRLRIVVRLATGDHRPCGSFDLPVSKSTCTHHFKVLRESGVIRQRLEGTTRLNSLRREDLEERFPGLLDSVLRAADEPAGTTVQSSTAAAAG